MRKLTLIFAFLLINLFARAGGYQVNLVGIRYIGMGHIGTALKLDAGSIFFNPGALPMLESKYSFTLGASGIFSYNVFRNQGTSAYEAKTDNPLGTPFSFFGSGKITEKLSLGLGVYTPFGSAVDWGSDWRGRFLVQDIELRTVFFQPTASYKITDKIGLGVGLVYARGSVILNRALPVNSTSGMEGQAKLEGSTSAWGFNAGLFINPIDNLNIGISYRSKVNMKVEGGDATFTVPASLATNFPTTTFDATLPLPGSINLGIAYQVSEKFLISTDINFVQWKAYDSLNFDFKENTGSLQDSKNPRNYENAFIIRLGGQYKIADALTVRAGTYFDMAPTQDNFVSPETPDTDRLGFSGGISVSPIERLSIDASFLWIEGIKREATFSPANFGGTYKARAFIPGLGLTYNF